MQDNNVGSRSPSVISNVKAIKEAICCNCGTTENIEWHHIVPICVGGRDVESNIMPLCHACHTALHRGQNITKYLRSEGKFSHGRKFVNDDETAYSVFDKLAGGLIGNSKCKELLGWKGGTHVAEMPQYKAWCMDRGYKTVRNNLDMAAVNGPDSLVNGKVIGYIDHIDGRREDILYQYSQENDTVYAFRNKKLYPVPCTLKERHEDVNVLKRRRRLASHEYKSPDAWWHDYKKEHYGDVAVS